LNDNYGASGQNVDFAVDASRTKINDWVEEFTQHKIKDLHPEGCIFIEKIISNTFIYLFMYLQYTYFYQIIIFLFFLGSVNSLTKLVLVNAVYFKGNWMRKFDPSLTAVEPFFLGSEDKQMNVNMMHIDAEFRTGYIESLDARLLELPYEVGSSLRKT
jgi:serpin B